MALLAEPVGEEACSHGQQGEKDVGWRAAAAAGDQGAPRREVEFCVVADPPGNLDGGAR